jgi:hypothetical protein
MGGDMTDQHEDPKFDQWLKNRARDYHSPLPTPRDAMWQRIAAARQRKHVIEIRPWMRWVVAAAAVLVIGIGIGRWSTNQAGTSAAPSTPVASINGATVDSSRDLIYAVAATQYLSRTEAFLTSYRADVGVGAGGDHAVNNARFARQARDLLSTTQLMLDSPAANDPRLRSLLEDLELVLMQISQIGAAHNGHDRDLITQGMNQTNVLPKLRSAIPAGPVPVRTEGAL